MEILLILFIIIIIAFVIFVFVAQSQEEDNRKKRLEKMYEILHKESDFIPSQTIIGSGNRYIFAVDENHRKLFYVKELDLWKYYIKEGHEIDENNKPDLYPKVIIPFDMIIDVSIVEDSSIVAQKSSIRTIGGAVAGGVLGGGAGAVVGGLSGNIKHKKEINILQVDIKLRNMNNPSITIECYNAKNNDSLEKGLRDAKHIADMIGVIIDDVDRNFSASAKNDITTMSLADELIKLSELRDKGILNDEEFAAQKERLLCNK